MLELSICDKSSNIEKRSAVSCIWIRLTSIARHHWRNIEQIVKALASKGQLVIVIHAGGEMGFDSNAFLMFQLELKTGDFHNDMTKNTDEK